MMTQRLSLLQCSILLMLATISYVWASPIASQPFADLATKREQGSGSNDDLIVDLGYSKYMGTFNQTTHIRSWKGIRFAAPPTGKLRWQAPQPPTLNRTTVVDAVQYGSQCPQIPFGNPNFVTSVQYQSDDEDCLFLNVFAPQNASNLPVMFWIHGLVLQPTFP